jgi:ElaB/YqjD/DUF883 family membrane-anchored ribosome-binding protein
MNPDPITRATEQAYAGLTEIADRAKDLRERVKDTYREAERGVRKLRIATEEGIHDTRRQIKSHPLAAMGMVAAGAFFLGGLVGRFRSRR